MSAVDPITEAITNPVARRRKALVRLQEHIDALGKIITQEAGTASFHTLSKNLVSKIKAIIQSTGDDPLTDENAAILAVAESVAETARNAYRVLAGQAGINSQTRARFARIGALYNDIYCTLRTATQKTGKILDLEPILGASNCSSTGGGTAASKFATGNFFEDLFALTNAGGVRMSSLAVSHLAAWRGDVLSQPDSAAASVDQSLRAIAGGVVIK